MPWNSRAPLPESRCSAALVAGGIDVQCTRAETPSCRCHDALLVRLVTVRFV